jgi:hypothetical protein
MKVKYLKEHLQNLPDDMEVLVCHHDGYERVYTSNLGAYSGTAWYVEINDTEGKLEWEDWVYSTQDTYNYLDKLGKGYLIVPEKKEVFILDV